MQSVLTLINKDVEESLALIASKFAPEYKFSPIAGFNFVLNSNLLYRTIKTEP